MISQWLNAPLISKCHIRFDEVEAVVETHTSPFSPSDIFPIPVLPIGYHHILWPVPTSPPFLARSFYLSVSFALKMVAA
jgi:hypothetical protein